MRYFITGAAGFIGCFVSKRLLEEGHRVVGMDNFNDYYDPSLKKNRLAQIRKHKNFTFIRANIENRAVIERAFHGRTYDCVIHLAAQAGVRYSLKNPHAYAQSNLLGFVNILEACRHRKVKHFVYASSSSVYGGNTQMPFSVHDNVDHPVSLYAATKKANELMAHTYAHLYGLPCTGLRFFTVYGPWGRPDMAYFSFTKAIFEGKAINIFNHGKMQRDFTYIDDIVDGVVKISRCIPRPNPRWNNKHPDPGDSWAPARIFNIGNHQPVKLMKFIETLEACIGKKAKKKYLPMQPGDVQATYADITDLQQAIGFQPSTNIQTGLRAFVNWYRKYYRVV
ncbi:MAG: NAD-dependent epimerase [Verrucomicrobiota bacterium]